MIDVDEGVDQENDHKDKYQHPLLILFGLGAASFLNFLDSLEPSHVQVRMRLLFDGEFGYLRLPSIGGFYKLLSACFRVGSHGLAI